jgi:hypothetical protein
MSRIPDSTTHTTASMPWYPPGRSAKSPQGKTTTVKTPRTPTSTPRAKATASSISLSGSIAAGRQSISKDATPRRKSSIESGSQKRGSGTSKDDLHQELCTMAVEARSAVKQASVMGIFFLCVCVCIALGYVPEIFCFFPLHMHL